MYTIQPTIRRSAIRKGDSEVSVEIYCNKCSDFWRELCWVDCQLNFELMPSKMQRCTPVHSTKLCYRHEVCYFANAWSIHWFTLKLNWCVVTFPSSKWWTYTQGRTVRNFPPTRNEFSQMSFVVHVPLTPPPPFTLPSQVWWYYCCHDS